MKSEIVSKLKAILNWSEGIDQYREESKSSSVYSVPDEIYGKEFKLWKIPTQTLKKNGGSANESSKTSKSCNSLSEGKNLIYI